MEQILTRPIIYDLPQEVEMPLEASKEPLVAEGSNGDEAPVKEKVLTVPIGIDIPEEVEKPMHMLEEL